MITQRSHRLNSAGFCLAVLMAPLLSGCADNRPSLEYSALVAEPPDFQANANPVYHYPDTPKQSAADNVTDTVRPVVDLPAGQPEQRVDDVGAAADADLGTKTATADQGQQTPPGAAPKGRMQAQANDNQATAAAVAAADDPVGAEEAGSDVPTSPSAPSADPVIGDAGTAGEPREIRLLIANKRFRDENGALRVSYDDVDLLKVLNMEPVPANAADHFPAWLKDLDGQRIRIRGFMYPTFEATGLTRFTLARDNGICCFVRQPLIYDVIGVDLADGVTTDYIDNKPFDVEGVFRIQPEADDTELYQLYRITDAKVVQ